MDNPVYGLVPVQVSGLYITWLKKLWLALENLREIYEYSSDSSHSY